MSFSPYEADGRYGLADLSKEDLRKVTELEASMSKGKDEAIVLIAYEAQKEIP